MNRTLDRMELMSKNLVEELLTAATATAAGNRTAAHRCANKVVERHDVHTATAIALAMVIDQLWRAGWLPADLWHVIRRRTDAATTGLLLDTMAADAAQHAPGLVHERRTEQLHQLEATIWWDRASPHLEQWALRHGVPTRQAIRTVIALAAALMKLPALPEIVPPPGTTTRRGTERAARVDQKILARVRALLAKAESTQFPPEAEALSAKAQELMNRHAFERALLDADTDTPNPATSTRLWLDSPYVEAKSHLVGAIAKANRCKAVFYPALGFVALVGEEMDLEITELLTTSLLVQATKAMVAEGSHSTRTRSFRRSFLISYAVRIGERLKEAGDKARDPTAADRLLPVLANRSRAVEDTYKKMFSHTVKKPVTIGNGSGWHAGRQAANRASLALEREALNAQPPT